MPTPPLFTEVAMKPKAGDFVIALAALLLAGVIAVSGAARGTGGVLTAVVTQDGREVRRIVLTGLQEPVIFTVGGAYENTIVAENGSIRVEDATCPRRTCVHTGRLTRAGQTAVCLENRLMITIVGGEEGLDAVIGG